MWISCEKNYVIYRELHMRFTWNSHEFFHVSSRINSFAWDSQEFRFKYFTDKTIQCANLCWNDVICRTYLKDELLIWVFFSRLYMKHLPIHQHTFERILYFLYYCHSWCQMILIIILLCDSFICHSINQSEISSCSSPMGFFAFKIIWIYIRIW